MPEFFDATANVAMPATNAHPLPTHRFGSCLLLVLLALNMAGCAALVAAGAGAGAYSYIAGNLERTYRAEYRTAVKASSQALSDLEIKVIGLTGDGLKTEIKGLRADDSPVRVEVERVNDQQTKIGVRIGYVGITDRQASELVHERISRLLPRTRTTRTADKAEPEKTAPKKKTSKPPEKVQRQKPAVTESAGDNAVRATPAAGSVAMPFARNPHYIYYRSTEEDIPASALTILDKTADYLLAAPAATIEIRGYTDSEGDPEVNLRLSRKRAESIKEYLKDRGVPASRISAQGYGARNFLESNKTEKLRVLNRRVEMELR